MKLTGTLLIFSALFFAYTQGAALIAKDDEAKLAAARALMDPKKIVTIGNRIYYINSLSRVSAGLAAVLCNDLQLVLASFETDEEYNAVREYINDNEVIYEFYITSGDRFGDRWIWSSTGEVINNFNWAPGNPISDPEREASIVISSLAGWQDLYNDVDWYFICEQK